MNRVVEAKNLFLLIQFPSEYIQTISMKSSKVHCKVNEHIAYIIVIRHNNRETQIRIILFMLYLGYVSILEVLLKQHLDK